MGCRRFPSGVYGRQRLQFFPAPFRAPLRAFASLVFPLYEGRWVLCQILDRGWCIPSGRVEPGESSADAARREAVEEAGAVLGPIAYLGCYRISERHEVRWADCYAARVSAFVPIGCTDESGGRCLATTEELPAIYHLWTPLTESLFLHAREVVGRMRDCP